ncbi:unnamed protein product [Diabrotica balteata]|uniref:Uncharacterized protein n=1 Tax=Diabrotica balteata TaxID=107213 RepID=A0A9N9T331_DIABA|nr:unnamed protein product [Diabrotica balteata]
MSDKRQRRLGVVSECYEEDPPKSTFNSLDWDSPSAKTGTVKKRPLSSESFLDTKWKTSQPSQIDQTLISTGNDMYKVQRNPQRTTYNLTSDVPKRKNVTESSQHDFILAEVPKNRRASETLVTNPRRIKVLSLDVPNSQIRYSPESALDKYELYPESRRSIGTSARNSIPQCVSSKIPLNKKFTDFNIGRPSDFSSPRRENQNQTTGQEQQENCRLRNLTKLNYPFHPSGGALPLENRGKCEKYKKILTLNGDFRREKEILIETNGLRKRETSGSFREGVGSMPDQNAAQTGKVSSDTDSGIASPLSPGSVYGFLGHLDKVNGFPRKLSLGYTGRDDVLRKKNCWCEGERVQVSECV